MTTDRERDEAVREVAQILAGRLAPTLDPRNVAVLAVDALHALGWRPIPRPQPIERRPAGDPPNTEWRQAADRIRNRAEGDTDA